MIRPNCPEKRPHRRTVRRRSGSRAPRRALGRSDGLWRKPRIARRLALPWWNRHPRGHRQSQRPASRHRQPRQPRRRGHRTRRYCCALGVAACATGLPRSVRAAAGSGGTRFLIRGGRGACGRGRLGGGRVGVGGVLLIGALGFRTRMSFGFREGQPDVFRARRPLADRPRSPARSTTRLPHRAPCDLPDGLRHAAGAARFRRSVCFFGTRRGRAPRRATCRRPVP